MFGKFKFFAQGKLIFLKNYIDKLVLYSNNSFAYFCINFEFKNTIK